MSKSVIFFRIIWSVTFILGTLLMCCALSWSDNITIQILSGLLLLGLFLIGGNHFVEFNEAKD
jgi:dolichol kinase